MSTQTLSSPSALKREESRLTLRPLGVGLSLLFFGVPAAIIFIAFHVLLPWVQSLGYDELTSFLVSLGLPLACLFFAALIAYKLEGRPMTWEAFAGRMRLPRLR